MAFLLQDDQLVELAVAFRDAAGNPAGVDGAPVWDSSDPTLVTVVAAPDGMSAVVTTLGPLGTCQVSVQADSDLGPDADPLIGLFDLEVVAGKAVVAVISAGAASPR